MKKKEKLEIKLKEIKTITNMSYMFSDDSFTRYESLLSLANVSKWDTRNVVVMLCLVIVPLYYQCQTFLNGILEILQI